MASICQPTRQALVLEHLLYSISGSAPREIADIMGGLTAGQQQDLALLTAVAEGENDLEVGAVAQPLQLRTNTHTGLLSKTASLVGAAQNSS